MNSQAAGRDDGSDHEFIVEKVRKFSSSPAEDFNCEGAQVDMATGGHEPRLTVGGANRLLGQQSK